MALPLIQTPFRFPGKVVPADWIEHNGHMNAWKYHEAFRLPIRNFFELLEFSQIQGVSASSDRDSSGKTKCGFFMLDFRVQYRREVLKGALLSFDVRLIDCSEKIIHYFVEMHAGQDEYLASTAEVLEIQMNMNTRRPQPFNTTLRTYLSKMLAAHNSLPAVQGVGQHMGIRRRKPVL